MLNKRVSSTSYASTLAESRPSAMNGGRGIALSPALSRSRERGMRSSCASFMLVPAGKRDETHRQYLAGGQRAILLFFHQHQVLGHELRAERDHHAAAWLQLLEQRRRHMACGSRHHDRVERRRLRPAVVAIAHPGLHVAVAERFQPLARLLPE